MHDYLPLYSQCQEHSKCSGSICHSEEGKDVLKICMFKRGDSKF